MPADSHISVSTTEQEILSQFRGNNDAGELMGELSGTRAS